MRSNGWIGLVAVGSLLALSGCGGQVRQALGMTKHSPDEFMTVAHAPLTLPPDYSLRPPQPGAPRPQEGTASEQGQTALLANNGGTAPTYVNGYDSQNDVAQSAGEVSLLQNAGAAGIDPGIRAQIDNETAAQIERDKSVIERLVFWRTPEPYGTVVDPAAEAQRLQDNQALGKPVTEGETPVVTRRKKGVLEGIF
jgi:Protein of unknown function (DUF3035)